MTCAGPAPRRGPEQGRLEIIADGALAIDGERIVFAGPTAELESALASAADARVVDARDFSILPGFVDAHTHAVFAGDRRSELRRRLAGETYASIAASGGGIVATVAATRAASGGRSARRARPRLDSMLACGTTTCEIKSGYGLDLENELKLLRAIAPDRRIASDRHRRDLHGRARDPESSIAAIATLTSTSSSTT